MLNEYVIDRPSPALTRSTDDLFFAEMARAVRPARKVDNRPLKLDGEQSLRDQVLTLAWRALNAPDTLDTEVACDNVLTLLEAVVPDGQHALDCAGCCRMVIVADVRTDECPTCGGVL